MLTNLNRLLFVISITLLSTGISTPGYGQYVIETAFCKSIRNNDCVGVIAQDVIRLRDLRRDSDGPVVSYWARIRSAEEYKVGISFVRQGPCYGQDVKVSDKFFKEEPGLVRTVWYYVTSWTVADIVNRLGFKVDGSVGTTQASPVDAKINIATIPPSQGYRVHDFRNVLCPGIIEARVFDSSRNPVPGDNPVKRLQLVK